MPNKEFLEQYPLYRRFEASSLPSLANQLPEVRIKMTCHKCASDQTFVMSNKYWDNLPYGNYPVKGVIFSLSYCCAHCQDFRRFFSVRVADDGKSLMKVGQYPAWDISSNTLIEDRLGGRAYHRNGLICESQGYGIGAFAYYRRVVEEVIDQLLEDIAGLLSDDEHERYVRALEETRRTTVAQDKIALVKELLPAILRPGGMNPLSTLHSVLSEGLHSESDEDCLTYAAAVQGALGFLVNQLAASSAASREFTASMKKLLEKKSKKPS